MPIIRSAKKRARQAEVRQARNYNVRTAVRKAIRTFMDAIKSGNTAEAEKTMPKAYKVIDTATKKKVLSKNTAARRKSLLARQLKSDKKAAPSAPAKKTAAKKAAPKKAAPKKASKKA